MQFVADPTLLMSMGIAFTVESTSFGKIGQHLRQRHVCLLFDPAWLRDRRRFSLARAPTLLGFLFDFGLGYRLLSRFNRCAVAGDMTDDCLSQGCFDQCLMDPGRQLLFSKLGKAPRERCLAGY